MTWLAILRELKKTATLLADGSVSLEDACAMVDSVAEVVKTRLRETAAKASSAKKSAAKAKK